MLCSIEVTVMFSTTYVWLEVTNNSLLSGRSSLAEPLVRGCRWRRERSVICRVQCVVSESGSAKCRPPHRPLIPCSWQLVRRRPATTYLGVPTASHMQLHDPCGVIPALPAGGRPEKEGVVVDKWSTSDSAITKNMGDAPRRLRLELQRGEGAEGRRLWRYMSSEWALSAS